MSETHKIDPWKDAEEIESERIRWTDEETKKPLVGQKIEGILLSKKIQPNPRSNTPGATSTVYEVYTEEGTKWFFGTTVLDRKLESLKGKIVRIECTGSQKSQKGNMVTMFSVRALPNTQEYRTILGIDSAGEEVGKDQPATGELDEIPF